MGTDRRVESRLDDADTGGLGALRIRHPAGTFALTPASRITMAAVGAERTRLRGAGIDWGSGVGCVAIAAARIPGVDRVVGLEIREENVRTARENARANHVAGSVRFLHADSWTPFDAGDRRALETLAGHTDFVVANPPASRTGDGFDWRREVARGAVAYLRPGGVLLIQISSQYGQERVRSLEAEGPGLRYDGLAATTPWVPFDLDRPDLMACLELYAEAESGDGPGYAFRWPDTGEPLGAREALARHRETGRSPLSRWQVQRFIYTPNQ